jgi:hypothetical protein
MPARRPPKDANQLARYIIEVTTGETEKIEPPKKNPQIVREARKKDKTRPRRTLKKD